MAELEVVAEEDVELNSLEKPAINKLKKLSLLTDVLSEKQIQQEFLDHGVLTFLKNWLEPLPDGSLQNTMIRAAVSKILNDFPIDLEQYDRRELKKSGLERSLCFCQSLLRRLQPTENLLKSYLINRVISKAAGMASRDDDLDLAEFSESDIIASGLGPKSG